MHTRQVLIAVFVLCVVGIVYASEGLPRAAIIMIAVFSGGQLALSIIDDLRYRFHKKVIIDYLQFYEVQEQSGLDIAEGTGLIHPITSLHRMVDEEILTRREDVGISPEHLAIRGNRPRFLYRLSDGYNKRIRA